jgi:hypothetical protein
MGERNNGFIALSTKMEFSKSLHEPIVASGIWPYGGHVLFAGEAGIGKSLFRTQLALHLAFGIDWLGFRVPKPRTVLIIQAENTMEQEYERIKKMCEGKGIEKIGGRIKAIRREDARLVLPTNMHTLAQYVKASECEVVIYDCLRTLHRSDENVNSQMAQVVESISIVDDECKTSSFLVHHFGKQSGNPKEYRDTRYRYRGAFSIFDWADTAMAFEAKGKSRKLLHFDKVRNGPSPSVNPMEFDQDEHLLFNPCMTLTICPPSQVAEILHDDLGGTVDTREDFKRKLKEITACSDGTANKRITETLNEGLIKKGKKGGFCIPSEQ